MGRVGVVDHHVFRLQLWRIQEFLDVQHGLRMKIVHRQIDVNTLPVNVDGAFLQKTTSPVSRLISGEENGFFASWRAIQVPKCRTALKHTRSCDDDVGRQCFLSVGFA